MENISVQEGQLTWRDFATVKQWKKQLRKKSNTKELAVGTWNLVENYFPGFLKMCKKTPDDLIEEALVDPEIGEDKLDEILYLKECGIIFHIVDEGLT